MSIDLSDLDLGQSATAGVDVPLVHPVTREQLEGTSIKLAGIDSEQYRKITRMQQERRLQALSRGRNALKRGVEDIEADALEVLAACTLGWTGIEVDGKPVECSKDSAMALYKRFGWIREQVDEAIADRSRFLGEQ